MMTAEACLIELDGRAYAWDAATQALRPLAQAPWKDSAMAESFPKLTTLVSDYGGVPQLREVCGRPRYLDSILARQLREEGEAVMGNVIITDSESPIDERCAMVLYQVIERPHYSRYVSLVDASSEACLLHSTSRLYSLAANDYKRGSTLLLFAHHEVLDLVAVEAGAVVGFRRLSGAFNGELRVERLSDLRDQVNALNQHLRNGLERMAVYEWLHDGSSGRSDWPQEISEHLQLPMVAVASGEVTIDGRARFSHWLPLLDRLSYRTTSAPSRNRWMAAAVAVMPLLALGLFLANAGLFMQYGSSTLSARVIAAELEGLNQIIRSMREREALVLAEYQPVLDSMEAITEARRLPGYAEILAELHPILNSELVVELDGVRMTYPGDTGYRRTATLGRDAVATASGEGVLIELAGSFLGDAMTVMDTFDELSRRLGRDAYRLLDSEVSTGAQSTDFMMILERLPNER